MSLFNDPKTADIDDPIDDGTDYKIEDFVGEGKKYKTLQDAAKALVNKDNFIDQLKRENQLARTAAEKLQDELKTRKTLQEFLDQMNTTQRQAPPPANNQKDDGEVDDNEFTPDKIKRLVEETIAQKSQAQREQENLDVVKQKLIEAYGPRYETKLRERTQELGMTEQDLTGMAMRTPKAFLSLVVPQSTNTGSLFTPPTNGINMESMRSGNRDSKTWSYYENIRKTDARTYYSPKIHNEMMEQLTKLGDDEFYK